MNNYVNTLLIVSILGGIVNSFISSFGSVKKYVSYFIGILTVLCFLSPVMEIISDITSLKQNVNELFDNIASEETIKGASDIIINTGTEAISNGIKKELINKYGFDEKEILIELETDVTSIESIKITKITIILTGKSSWSDVDTVKKYLENIIGGNIIVVRK